MEADIPARMYFGRHLEYPVDSFRLRLYNKFSVYSLTQTVKGLRETVYWKLI